MASTSTTENASRAAAISGRGTGFGVEESVWTRVLTDDKRVYYFNRATGASQWHLPNDIYTGTGDGNPSTDSAADGCTVVYPTHAKATLRVDCVTEVLPPQPMSESAMPAVASQEFESAQAVIAAIHDDPHDTEIVCAYLPGDMVELLKSDDFQALCKDCFRDAAGDSESIPWLDSFPATFEVVQSIGGHSPHSLAHVDPQCLRDLATLWNTEEVSEDDFPNFARFVVATRYFENLAQLEKV
eukprot:TRINITY_DN69668_c0_g1_i1.p1 TRINITY_DN69668_c0_g1~~TRINITY_DN69668_c0_g1_i1.p1  ORF type:complete len:283 (-),score=33.67 TRINITY_DN69668_c0_g1_i1:184-909(-)